MLYLLYQYLSDHHLSVPGLNLIRYLTFRGGMAVEMSRARRPPRMAPSAR